MTKLREKQFSVWKSTQVSMLSRIISLNEQTQTNGD